MAAVLAVVIVACLVLLGVRYATSTEGSAGERLEQLFSGDDAADETTADDSKTRELVMSQANQFLLRINTYGPSDLEADNTMPGYAERVREVITPKFAVDFDKNLTLAEQSVSQAGVARTAQLYSTATESLESDAASVLVAGAITQSVPDPEKEGRIEYEPLQFRYQVTLIKTEGSWLVDDFVPVTGEDPEDDLPTDPATGGAEEPASPYAAIVSRRQGGIAAAAGAVDDCGYPRPAESGDAACAEAPDALAAAARTLASSLRGAANPDSRVYVGEAPSAELAPLVEATDSAATDVVDAVAALSAECRTTDSRQCSDRRADVTTAAAILSRTLDSWEPYL